MSIKTSFFQGLTGEIITPKSSDYNEERQEYNRSIQKFPLVIVLCNDSQDVINAVLWCRKHSVSIRVRNGRHNYEGYSVGDDVLVIDISRLNSMKINHDKNLLYAEGGVNVRQLYDFVSSRGYPFPGGSCPTVGIAAYALGGGWGYSARQLGLGCDSLREIKLVNYKGKIITASSSENSDLFWACQGGAGGNYGVVISMVFNLPPKLDKITYIEIHYPNTDKKKQVDFIKVWQDWLEKADKRITLTAVISNSKDGLNIFSRGLFYGKPEEAQLILKPFLKLGGELTVIYLPFLEALKIIGSVYPSSEMFKTTGRFVYRHYSEDTIKKLINIIQTPAEGSVLAGFTLYAMGGRIADVGTYDTAFYYRNARYLVAIQSVWEDKAYQKENIEWVEKNFKYLKSITDGSYVNFPYNKLPNYLIEYYGKNSYKLQQVKSKYDPLNIFHYPQSIPPNKKKIDIIDL